MGETVPQMWDRIRLFFSRAPNVGQGGFLLAGHKYALFINRRSSAYPHGTHT